MDPHAVTTASHPQLDLLIVGSGIAGLSAAVRAVGHGLRVGVLTKGELAQATTRWAQGGVAAVLTGDPDSTDLHLADTLAAGGGLCDEDAVRVLVEEGPDRVRELIDLGARFDRDDGGGLQFAREGGHTLARIVHAGGAATGAEIERALVAAVRRTGALVLEHTFALDLVVESGRCRGIVVRGTDGSVGVVRADHVLLAAGGAGQLYAVTTNPPEATGDGIAMALRAGAAVADIEFIQFHPTALSVEAMPRPLLTEAIRGHGAVLLDTTGERFVDELLPRDRVSRASVRRMAELGTDHVLLDARGLTDFVDRFPTIADALGRVGLDPARDLLPVAPAAHYTCGGVLTDLRGATSLPGLWAAGEVTCSGVHGANRLASNSLLEGLVFGPRAVDAVAAGVEGSEATGAMRSLLPVRTVTGVGVGVEPTPSRTSASEVSSPEGGGPDHGSVIGGEVLAMREVSGGSSHPMKPAGTAGGERPDGHDHDRAGRRQRLQRLMSANAGVVRDAERLALASRVLDELGEHERDPELRNLLTVGRAVVTAAARRTESRGAHTREDHPDTDPRLRHRLVLRAEIPDAALRFEP